MKYELEYYLANMEDSSDTEEFPDNPFREVFESVYEPKMAAQDIFDATYRNLDGNTEIVSARIRRAPRNSPWQVLFDKARVYDPPIRMIVTLVGSPLL